MPIWLPRIRYLPVATTNSVLKNISLTKFERRKQQKEQEQRRVKLGRNLSHSLLRTRRLVFLLIPPCFYRYSYQTSV